MSFLIASLKELKKKIEKQGNEESNEPNKELNEIHSNPGNDEVSRKDTGLGVVDFGVIHTSYEEASTSKRSKYMKWSEKDRYEIGKYASLNGPAATVRKFKQRFPALNESTTRTFRSKVEADLKARLDGPEVSFSSKQPRSSNLKAQCCFCRESRH